MAATARLAAVKALCDVLADGQSLSNAIPKRCEALQDARDRGFAKEIIFGVMRWLPRLEWQLDQLLQKPLKRKDIDIGCVLLSGLYQLQFMQVSDYAAVNESVEVARKLKKQWAKGLINAVLRNYQRQQDKLEKAAANDPEAHWAHPQWLLDRLQQAWPDDWPNIVEANNQQAPMVLRVNAQKTSRDAYRNLLAEAELSAVDAPFTTHSLLLDKAADVGRLPGFFDGLVSVQDSSAQLAAGLLDLHPGQRVLDACAAPGGKTAHILESQSGLQVVAIDKQTERTALIADTLSRLQLHAEINTADVANPDAWWDGQPFDRILLDAPCSATGVIRRNPDIKSLRQDSDIETLCREQQKILQNTWPLLAKGGRLVYATCSVLPQENWQQIAQFLHQQQDAEDVPIKANWGRTRQHGRQILPGENNMDGFYYACLEKQ